MKKRTLALLASVAAIVSGCVVTSVAPYYTEKDVVFEPGLIGNWIKTADDTNSDSEVWKFEKKGASAYRFTWITSEKAMLMDAHAFKLQGQLFVDLSPVEKDWTIIPPHYLLKVSPTGSSLHMATLSHDWLKQFVAKEPASIMHQLISSESDSNDKRVVLTADTPELQKFVLKNLKTPEAWDQEFVLTPEPATAPTRETKK